MPLVSMKRILADAERRGYAVCYCEAWNIESLQAVLEAAEEAQSPVITGFNGGFLMHPSRSKPEALSFYAGMGQALAATTVPLAFLLNETDDFQQISQGIKAGFNAIMVENERLKRGQYLALVKKVVRLAHARNACVEAQIGHLPNGLEGLRSSGEITDPEVAKKFVEETGIDALGVSIGNVHILTCGKASIDLEALRQIHRVVKVPLVVHGGTGFPPELAKEVIGLGVAKLNFGTALKQVYLATVQEKLSAYREPLSPHPFVGMGGPEDIMVAGREAVKRKVKDLLSAYGSAGKANKR